MYMMTRNYRNTMADMMNEMMRPFFDRTAAGFSVDVRDNGEGYELTADLPGVKKEDIDITMENDVVTITANFGAEEKTEKDGYRHIERRSGRMTRSFNVEGIDQNNITAAYENGVLKLNLPKEKKDIPTARHIAIGGGNNDSTAA